VGHGSSFASWTFAVGGDIFDYDSGQYTYNSEAAVAAMTYMQDLFNDGCASIVVELYGDQTDFGQGATLFTVGSSSGLSFYSEAVEAGSGHEWRVAAVPHTTDDPVMNISGASISMPLAPPEAQLASWLFLKHFTTTENQAKWAQVSNYFPVRASAADGLGDYFAENPAYQTAFDMLQYGTTEPPIPGYDFVSIMVEDAMAAIVDGADVVETLNTLTEDANISLADQLSQ
jgi:ABC-type glycerol-3-phosphate transport system substrate-binding protein